FVDSGVSGEADIVFPEMVRRVLEGRPVSDIQGVFSREKTSLPVLNGPVKNTPVIQEMDSIPIPDYDDYFQQLAGSSLDLSERVHLLFETSRGCWWGEKHHCTFCGLNGETMAHRSKSAERALSELAHLADRYPGLPVRVVDNILDMDYFKSFIPRLAGQNRGLKLFYEVKSNLKKDQVRQLRDAGITLIQPGIESLSDAVLKIMRKGVRGLQNIQLLKWCEELGVVPEWNLLWGFPGEPEQEYPRMAKLVPLLIHLQPPVAAVTIRIDRFSPNFNRAQELGFKSLTPYPAYYYVYNLPAEAINNLAYYFTFEYIAPQDVASYVRPLAIQVAEWQKCYEKSALFYIEKGDRLLIWDTRPVASEPLLVLSGLSKLIYELCDQIRSPGQLLDMCRKLSHQTFDLQTVTATLEELTARKIMIEENGSYLALAVRGEMEEIL
ncbi:MAG TPA: RiPP maturation radical SAM C-methyltransferase, partial [Blastocatellia bacterium]|nr:RiPP maturation radical SAM C-methyltransferase [Blastocatellia bacterium]